MDRFPICLAETLKWEGGYSDDRYDPGGKTMRGIIQKEYDAYRVGHGLPPQWVKLISDVELRDIYHRSYWAPVRADEVFAGLDLELFDEAVNSGPVTAVKHLQQVLNIVPDGHIGTQTLDAIRRVNDRESLIAQYMERRRTYLRSLKTFWRFGHGWMDRCDGVEHAAHATAGNVFALAAVDVPLPHPDVDTQSASQGRAPAEAPTPPVATELALAGGGGSSIVAAAPNVIAKAASSGRMTIGSLIVAVLQEPLFWVGMVTLWGAVAAFLWRRKHA